MEKAKSVSGRLNDFHSICPSLNEIDLLKM